jgi:predicted enzyme related to lactoylglutathione lyase
VTVQFAAAVIYARDLEATVSFYEKNFGFKVLRASDDRIVELVNDDGGGRIMVHQAAKSVKQGQSTVKLVFAVEDVAGFCAARAADGLDFGPLHEADGYVYANARDPSGNPISVSSRAFRKGG